MYIDSFRYNYTSVDPKCVHIYIYIYIHISLYVYINIHFCIIVVVGLLGERKTMGDCSCACDVGGVSWFVLFC